MYKKTKTTTKAATKAATSTNKHKQATSKQRTCLFLGGIEHFVDIVFVELLFDIIRAWEKL